MIPLLIILSFLVRVYRLSLKRGNRFFKEGLDLGIRT